jgi:hypothetical protein
MRFNTGLIKTLSREKPLTLKECLNNETELKQLIKLVQDQVLKFTNKGFVLDTYFNVYMDEDLQDLMYEGDSYFECKEKFLEIAVNYNQYKEYPSIDFEFYITLDDGSGAVIFKDKIDFEYNPEEISKSDFEEHNLYYKGGVV